MVVGQPQPLTCGWATLVGGGRRLLLLSYGVCFSLLETCLDCGFCMDSGSEGM